MPPSPSFPTPSIMSRFPADLQPLVKNVKYSLRQLDEASGPQCLFACCARLADGKLALLHCANFDKASSSTRKDVARGMKHIFGTFPFAGSSVVPLAPSSRSAMQFTPGPSVSPPSSDTPSDPFPRPPPEPNATAALAQSSFAAAT